MSRQRSSDALSSEPKKPLSAHFLLMTNAWTLAGTALYMLAPAVAPGILVLCPVLPLAWHWYAHNTIRASGFTPVAAALAVATAYAFANASWSPAKSEALGFAITLLLVAACTTTTIGTLASLGMRQVLHVMAVGFYAGFAIVGAILCFEVLSHAAIHAHMMTVFPALWQNSSEYIGGALPDHLLNHRMVSLVVLFWPACIAVRQLASVSLSRRVLLAGLLPPAIAIMASNHETSKVALLISAAVYTVWGLLPRFSYRILVTTWVVACLTVVPLCLSAYAYNLHNSAWLQQSAKHRIVIWKATSDRVLDAPILGRGISAARVIRTTESEQPIAPGTPYRLSVSLHSHNAFLQVWFEAGATGALILLVLGLLILRSIRNNQKLEAQPALFATFASCSTVAASGYSAFAPWLSASFALAAIFASLAVAAATLPLHKG